ncbi:MAG: hypothetical protein FJ297_03740 [Planctomycetes bacterium]|nr:hypothetical protein [Planctomycetota bacterium]
MTTTTAPSPAPVSTSTRYEQRLARYVAAMRNEKPDMVPIRPFVAEFTAKYAGMDCQQVTQDFRLAFDAAIRCAADFDWDAVVANMVYVWGMIPQVIGSRYLAVPGVGLERDTGFQYLEPAEDGAWMRADEYDALIDDPTGYVMNVWMPRVSRYMVSPGETNTVQNNLAWLKGGMSVMQYFTAFGGQIERLREECGTVSAIAGILKAPFDIIADKFRGYLGLTMDLFERPEKVMAAVKAMMPHMLHIALSTADPAKQVPITIWMHRGCVPFISPKQFDEYFWPTLKPIIEEIWGHGHQTLFYAEGKWKHHWGRFRELPEGSIIYHCDRDDVFEAHAALGDRFAISGGIPNFLLSFGTPDQVREYCRKVIDVVAADGGYIMDAGAIMQNDTSIENIKAMTEFTREYGVY